MTDKVYITIGDKIVPMSEAQYRAREAAKKLFASGNKASQAKQKPLDHCLSDRKCMHECSGDRSKCKCTK